MSEIVLVDDHAVVRDGLRFLLDRAGRKVVAECGDVDEALQVLASHPGSLVILDLNLPGRDGWEAIGEIRSRFPQVRILVLSMHGERPHVVRALQAGAQGYALKGSSREELLAAVAAIEGGGSYLDPRLAGVVVEAVRQGPAATTAPTERERTLLDLVAQGLNNQQIADRLHLSVSSVKLHLADLFARYGVKDRVSLVMAALGAGDLPPQTPPRPNR